MTPMTATSSTPGPLARNTWDEALLGGPALQAESITTRELSAGIVYAGEVNADQINSGTLDADLIVGASIKTAETGQRVEITGAQAD